MLRQGLPLAAALLAAGVVGCAHCDTGDDFPLPGSCVYGGGTMAGPGTEYGTVPSPYPSAAPNAPTAMTAPEQGVTTMTPGSPLVSETILPPGATTELSPVQSPSYGPISALAPPDNTPPAPSAPNLADEAPNAAKSAEKGTASALTPAPSSTASPFAAPASAAPALAPAPAPTAPVTDLPVPSSAEPAQTGTPVTKPEVKRPEGSASVPSPAPKPDAPAVEGSAELPLPASPAEAPGTSS